MCFQTRITTSERFQTSDQASPSFTIDFGERVVQMDPTRLFNISGTNRTDIEFDVGSGRMFITAYILDTSVGTSIT